MTELEKKYMELLGKNIIRVKNTIKKMKFDDNDSQQLFSISLLCTIFEFTDTCYQLIKNNRYSSIPILLRNLLEANIDLINLVNCEDYSQNMAASYLNGRNKFLKEAVENTDNEYLKGLSGKDDIQIKYNNSLAEQKELKNNGHKALLIKEKFMLAKSLDLYNSVYNELCQETHNNISALEGRHYDRKIKKITIFKMPEEDEMLRYLDSLNGIIVTSCEKITEIISIKDKKELIDAVDELKNLREE